MAFLTCISAASIYFSFNEGASKYRCFRHEIEGNYYYIPAESMVDFDGLEIPDPARVQVINFVRGIYSRFMMIFITGSSPNAINQLQSDFETELQIFADDWDEDVYQWIIANVIPIATVQVTIYGELSFLKSRKFCYKFDIMKRVNRQSVPSFSMLSRVLLSVPDLAHIDYSWPRTYIVEKIDDTPDQLVSNQDFPLPKDVMLSILVYAVLNGASYMVIRQVCKFFSSILTIRSLISDYNSALYVVKRINPLIYFRLKKRMKSHVPPEHIILSGKLYFSALSMSNRLHLLSNLLIRNTKSEKPYRTSLSDQYKVLIQGMRALMNLEKTGVTFSLETVKSLVFSKRDDIFILSFLKEELTNPDEKHRKAACVLILHYINIYFPNNEKFSKVLHFITGERECARFIDALIATYKDKHFVKELPEHGILE